MTRRKLMETALVGCAGFLSCSTPETAEAPSAESSQAASSEAAEAGRFDVEALKKRIDGGENVFLLDVRQPNELEEIGTIEGYTNIPIDQLEARLSEVPKGRPLVVY